MKTKITTNILATAFLAALVSPVFALEGEDWYLGASVGNAEVQDFCKFVVVSCDDSDTGWKLFGGYNFNPYWGAEVYYADFGEAKGKGNVDADAYTFGISAIATWPINDQFDVFGKVGLSHWLVDVSVSANAEGNTATVPVGEEDGTDVTFGLGASYSFNKQYSIRIEWERSKVGNDNSTGEDFIDLISIGGVYYF